MRIAWLYLVQYLKVRLSYRWDLLAQMAGDFVGAAAQLAFLAGVFAGAGIDSIAGWPREAILFIYGFSIVSFGLYETWGTGLYRFGDAYLIEGRLDQLLLRPVAPLLQVLMNGFNLSCVPDVLLGGTLMAWAGSRLGGGWGVADAAALALLAACGGIILLSVFLALTSLHFWFEDRFGIQPPVYNCVVFGRYPIEVFHPAIRFLLRFVIPFAFIGYYPAGIFVAGGRWDAATYRLAWMTPLVALLCALAAGALWRAGIRRYHSTGS